MISLQKASMWKRISAFLFDGILLAIVAVLCALAMSGLTGYNQYAARIEEAYDYYGQVYATDLRMSSAEYEAMDEAGKQNLQSAFDALNADEEAKHALAMSMELSLLIISFGLLLGFLIMEFAIPLLFKNGQTLGKKIFGIAVMHTSGVKISPPMLFARTILGKYAVETMVPVFIILMIFMGQMDVTGTVVLLLLLLLQAGVMIGTHTNSMIHDLLAKTVAVDYASQRIFDTQEELLAFKKKQHTEKVAADREGSASM